MISHIAKKSATNLSRRLARQAPKWMSSDAVAAQKKAPQAVQDEVWKRAGQKYHRRYRNCGGGASKLLVLGAVGYGGYYYGAYF